MRVGLCWDPPVLVRRHPPGLLRSLDVLMFPELLDGGYAALRQSAPPHRPGDPFIRFLCCLSVDHPFCCIAGSLLYEEPRGRHTNTSLVFLKGRQIHRYDKIHLFRPTGDTRFFVPGRAAETFMLPVQGSRVRAGVILCYDLRFPELIRLLAADGMRILFVPARWPRVRDDAWRTLLKARAIENQIFVVGCNARDSEGGFSYAFDPRGELIFSSRNNRGALQVVTLDLALIAEAQRVHRNLRDAALLKRLLGRRPVRLPERGGRDR